MKSDFLYTNFLYELHIHIEDLKKEKGINDSLEDILEQDMSYESIKRILVRDMFYKSISDDDLNNWATWIKNNSEHLAIDVETACMTFPVTVESPFNREYRVHFNKFKQVMYQLCNSPQDFSYVAFKQLKLICESLYGKSNIESHEEYVANYIEAYWEELSQAVSKEFEKSNTVCLQKEEPSKLHQSAPKTGRKRTRSRMSLSPIKNKRLKTAYTK